MLCFSLFLLDSAKSLPRVIVPICTPICNNYDFLLSHTLTNPWSDFCFCQSNDYEVASEYLAHLFVLSILFFFFLLDLPICIFGLFSLWIYLFSYKCDELFLHSGYQTFVCYILDFLWVLCLTKFLLSLWLVVLLCLSIIL